MARPHHHAFVCPSWLVECSSLLNYSEVHVVPGEHAAGGVSELSRVPVHVDVLVVVRPVVAGGRGRVGPVVLQLVVQVVVVLLLLGAIVETVLFLVVVIAAIELPLYNLVMKLFI